MDPDFVIMRSCAGLSGEEAAAGLGVMAMLTEPDEVVIERTS